MKILLDHIKYINIFTQYYNQDEDVLAIYNLSPVTAIEDLNTSKVFSIGIQPIQIPEVLQQDIETLKTIARNDNIIAIGESGLDKSIETPLSIQQKFFLEHIQLSESLGKPLIIYCVKCWSELITLRKETKASMPWIIHGFNNSTDVAFQLTRLGIFISFGRSLLFPASRSTKVIGNIPIDYLFFDTSDSAIKVSAIYDIASEIMDIKIGKLIDIVKSNFIRCFKNIE